MGPLRGLSPARKRIEFLEIHNSSRNQKQIQKATNHRHKMSEIHSQIEQKLSLETSWGSFESQQAPQGGRRGPKRAPGGSKGTPREFQESPKSPPRRSQESPREPPRPQQLPKRTEIITNMAPQWCQPRHHGFLKRSQNSLLSKM